MVVFVFFASFAVPLLNEAHTVLTVDEPCEAWVMDVMDQRYAGSTSQKLSEGVTPVLGQIVDNTINGLARKPLGEVTDLDGPKSLAIVTELVMRR